MTVEERFWEKVEKSDGCWEWKGGKVGDGVREKTRYGRFATSTTRGNVVLVLPHRFSWELHHGPIPKGLFVLHACDNPPCVRPDHLLLGTQTANMLDASNKGRLGKSGAVVRQLAERRRRKDPAA
jgi:hypothetical protein